MLLSPFLYVRFVVSHLPRVVIKSQPSNGQAFHPAHFLSRCGRSSLSPRLEYAISFPGVDCYVLVLRQRMYPHPAHKYVSEPYDNNEGICRWFREQSLKSAYLRYCGPQCVHINTCINVLVYAFSYSAIQLALTVFNVRLFYVTFSSVNK